MTRQTSRIYKLLSGRIRCGLVYGLPILFALAGPIGFAQSSLESSAELAGHVIVARGDVIAQDANGSPRTSNRNSGIYVGDTVFTAAAASTQIRMIDNALIALKESTEFAIVAYQYDRHTRNRRVDNTINAGWFPNYYRKYWQAEQASL